MLMKNIWKYGKEKAEYKDKRKNRKEQSLKDIGAIWFCKNSNL